MTLVLQNDSGSVADANAYIDAAFFRSYHADRCNDATEFDTDEVEGAIIRATDYLDQRFRYVGEQVGSRQRTQWPRLDAEDINQKVRTGLPHEIQEATADYALIALAQTLNPIPDRDGTGRTVQAKFEKVDVIEERTELVGGAAFKLPEYPVADQKLIRSGLVITGIILRRA